MIVYLTILGTSILYFSITCLIRFGVVELHYYSLFVETLYVKLYYFRCLIHMIMFCWFLCLVKHVRHLSVELKIELFTKCQIGELGCYSKRS